MQNASVTLLCFTSRFSSVFVLLLNIFKVIFYKKPGQKKSPLCFSVWSSVTPVFEEPNPSLCRTASKNLQFTWFLMCWWSNNLLLVCMYYCWMSAYDKTCRSGCIMNWVGFFYRLASYRSSLAHFLSQAKLQLFHSATAQFHLQMKAEYMISVWRFWKKEVLM